MKIRIFVFGIVFCSVTFLCNDSTAQEKSNGFQTQFIDSVDNALDISVWLSQIYGFLPVVGIITEPATGYGVAGGLVFLQKKKKPGFNGKPVPPDISVLGGAYTENGTWAGILAHKGFWKQDRIRFTGAAGYVSPNLAIYADNILGETIKLGFNLDGPLFYTAVSHRVKNSNSLLGGQYIYMENTVKFDGPFEDPPVKPEDLESTLSGLGILYTYDSRDNTFTPNTGIYSNVSTFIYNEFLGSSEEYFRIDSYIIGFKPISKKLIIGGRFDYRAAFKSPPFYALPFVPLRGVPAFRYQGEQLIVLETEERWDFTNRWSLTAFAGVGKGFENLEGFDQNDWAYSLGGGFRYFLAKSFKLYTGIDIARGPEDWAFYIQFGHYWNSL
jgi:hypothetical protein